jgi:Asp-tRNA(Asn)/Glu-tRNA(Gln) amidotransferase A subunit family amidase
MPRTPPLHQLGAWQAARLLARRELRAADLVRACLDRIAEREPQVHAFAHLDPDAALAMARALDAGPLRGPLHGLPLGVKDLIDTADMPTTYGSAIYAGHRPAADAAALALCREAGALALGKTVSTEFAYFQPGPTRNPHHLEHTPGGSSSGSAAAVAAQMLPLALGTQTAGSIIRPAAYCGVVGFKPSLGRVPRAGIKSLSESLDTVGGFGRSVRDVALLGAVLTGDARLADLPAAPDLPALRIGIVRTPEWPQADADVQRLFAGLEGALAPHAARVDAAVEIPPDLVDWVALQKSVMAFEMARSLSAERTGQRDRLGERLRALMDEGMAIDGARHAADLARVLTGRRSIDALFDHFDVLLAPSATGEAPPGLDATGDPLFCRGWTLLGLPCVHLPVGHGRQGLPIGLQAVGRHAEDHRLLAAAARIHDLLTR